MDKPMTTAEFFDKINGILKEKKLLPDILDYGLATYRPTPMLTYEYSVRNNLDYGESEGIYLDIWIMEYDSDGKKIERGLGTYKTLKTDDEAMRAMAKLLADFIVEQGRYVNENLDDFTWTGVDVYPTKEDGEKSPFGYSCRNMERALLKKMNFCEIIHGLLSGRTVQGMRPFIHRGAM